jgi:hypothetical protein
LAVDCAACNPGCFFCRDAQLQDELARQISTGTRQLLAAGKPPSLTNQLQHNAAHLLMPQGGIATLRLAQPLLIGFCTKLDWGGK